ncbi:PREDICTED: cardiolipin synthase (CMP-forming) isoform X2 [Gekko japonicus]|uniref:cardiolipin synthase (CMP-forming) n=1 Tax=Gekko japonicus TaxID=146911 RepID=A0ABM1KGY7_GEKJA|nr:PREDICTED: cardiolipin synthase (CMP-forming) isoform X2 [Gekko japonicus]
MLTAAWLCRGAACKWSVLRSASPARPVAATVAAAGAAAIVARRSNSRSRASLAASSLAGLAAPSPPSSPCGSHRRLLRVRERSSELLVGRTSAGGFPSGGAGQPRRSRSSDEGASRPPGKSSELDAGRADRERRAELYENPWTVPNLLSMARIGLAPVLGYLIVEEDFNIALGVFALAGITDLLDGFIARNWVSQKSVLGSALDPLADKVLISVLYISMTYANLIPVPLTSMIVVRDIALIAAVFYVRYRTLPPPRTLSRYFNPCYATAQLKPTFISKMNTVVQLILVAASLAAPVFNYVDSVYLQTLWYLFGSAYTKRTPLF